MTGTAAGEAAVVLRLLATDPEATVAAGRALGRTAPDGAVLLLDGPLGAGKTTFARGVGAGCGVEGPIPSPTYNLILHHRGEREMTHVDLYRIEDEADLATLDLDEVLDGSGVTCVEWPGRIAGLVAPPWAGIALARVGPAAREIGFRLVGPGWEAAARALAELGAAPA